MGTSWNDPVPRPKTRHCEPVTRRARVLAARANKNVTVRRAILLGHWDGGSVLNKYGLPLTLPLDTPGRSCEALEGTQAGQSGSEDATASEAVADAGASEAQEGSAAAEEKED
jgi:hypothetical protein